MLRKLASLLFKEEEVIIEEETHEEESVYIPPVSPLEINEPVIETFRSEDSTPKNTEDAARVQTEAKKSFRIDLDDTSPRQKPDVVMGTNAKSQDQSTSKPYHSKEIISPIHGGPHKTDEPVKASVNSAKRRTPLTEVISPMYGKVEDEAVEKQPIDTSILEMDVTTMITPDYETEKDSDDVQTTLFDYLEGMDSSES